MTADQKRRKIACGYASRARNTTKKAAAGLGKEGRRRSGKRAYIWVRRGKRKKEAIDVVQDNIDKV